MTAPATLTGWVVVPGWEGALLAELGVAPGARRSPRWPGLITTWGTAVAPDVTTPDPAFSLQVLPDAKQVKGEGTKELAVGAAALVEPILQADGAPIVLHVYVPDRVAYRNVAGQAAVLEAAFGEQLKALGLLDRLVASRRSRFADSHLVQLALVGRTSLLVSAARPRTTADGTMQPAPFVAGAAPVPEDRTAPSRANRKLVEGFAWLGAAPEAGQTVVDLGGAPGGWAFTALTCGAAVTAVDRSALSPPALGHPKLTMVIGNAFTYRPPGPVDWLLCDVICEPARTIDLVDRWVGEGLCGAVVATLKFKGEGDYPAIGVARARLARHGWFLRIKHLRNHNNEAAILMRRR